MAVGGGVAHRRLWIVEVPPADQSRLGSRQPAAHVFAKRTLEAGFTACRDVVSEAGKVSVVKAAGEWSILKVNKLDDQRYATPAIVDGVFYLRGEKHLFAIGTNAK
jgi:hypothetical protein